LSAKNNQTIEHLLPGAFILVPLHKCNEIQCRQLERHNFACQLFLNLTVRIDPWLF
jgi:hypothetical protein